MGRALYDNGNFIGKDALYGTDHGMQDIQLDYANKAELVPLYVNRSNNYGSSTYTSFPTNVTLSGSGGGSSGWGTSNNESDALRVHVSGSGTYKIHSISRFMNYYSGGSNQVTYLAIFDGSQTGSTQLAMRTTVRSVPGSTNRVAEEYQITNPPRLIKGRTYTVAMGYAAYYGYNLPYIPNGQARSQFTTSYGTITLMSMDTTFGSNQSFTHPSITPFQYNNGTTASAGQLPVIGFLF